MKIALIGYGKMGKIIEKISIIRGHQIVAKIEKKLTKNKLNHPDVVIEFTEPNVAYENIKFCIDYKIPVVSGTTGWTKYLSKIQNYCLEKEGAFIYSSNFSLGMNIFFEINKKVAKIIKKQFNYLVKIEETHHLEKKDMPSGTAISLANDLIKEYKFNKWIINQNSNSDILGIFSKRKNNIIGDHKVIFSSKEDNITIHHSAKNREGFALGAVIAAEFLFKKIGVFTMKDVLNI